MLYLELQGLAGETKVLAEEKSGPEGWNVK